MTAGGSVSIGELAASAQGRAGVVWTLEASIELNANLVCFGIGGGVGEHVNDEVEVIIVGIAGFGFVRVDGEEHPVSNGTLTFVPRGVRRSTRSLSEDFAYLTVHRRRSPPQIGR
jgi:quercetin dioxygenase-like cupin family protein